MLLIWLTILLISIVVLTKSSDILVEMAEKVSKALGFSTFIIGASMLAFGTSLPELTVSLISALEKSPGIIIGNVIGSNITNILLVLGASILLGERLSMNKKYKTDFRFLLFSALMFYVFSLDGVISLIESMTLIFIFVVYVHNINKTRTTGKGKITAKTFIIVILSLIGIFFGAKYAVISVIKISGILNIGKDIISSTILALGTSLPELSTSLSAVKKKHIEMAAGNVVGSNIFNSFIAIGLPGLLIPLSISKTMINIGLPIMILATLTYILISNQMKIPKWQGSLLIIFYVIFLLLVSGIVG